MPSQNKSEVKRLKTVDKRRMDKLRVEDEVKEHFKKKLVRSRLKWTGHVERMRDENWQRDETPRKWREKGVEED